MPSSSALSRTTNIAGLADSVGGPTLGSDVLKCLVEILSMSAPSQPSVEQARRLGVTSFYDTTDPTEALFWLSKTKKVLDEGMQC